VRLDAADRRRLTDAFLEDPAADGPADSAADVGRQASYSGASVADKTDVEGPDVSIRRPDRRLARLAARDCRSPEATAQSDAAARLCRTGGAAALQAVSASPARLTFLAHSVLRF